MPNKELGIADPVYDALRIRSGQSIAPDLGGGSFGAGGVENKIYVWHADGSTIDTFDPDAAGLGFAITAAATGDTVWLPSMTIALTAGITIPAGVTLQGISETAILSFSGFAGTGVTPSAGSVLRQITVLYNGTGQVNATGLAVSGIDGWVVYQSNFYVHDATGNNYAATAEAATAVARGFIQYSNFHGHGGANAIGLNLTSGGCVTVNNCSGLATGASTTNYGVLNAATSGKENDIEYSFFDGNTGSAAMWGGVNSGYLKAEHCNFNGTTGDLNNSGTLRAYAISYTTLTNSGTLTYLRGDRSAVSVEDWHGDDIEAAALTRHLPKPASDDSDNTKVAIVSGHNWIMGNPAANQPIVVDYSAIDVSNPPTKEQIDSAFGTPGTVGAGYLAMINDNAAALNEYLVASDGFNWWFMNLTKAVAMSVITSLMLAADSYTGSNGTHLNVHTMDAGSGWTENEGSWTIQSNTAQQSASGGTTMKIVTTDIGTPNARLHVKLKASTTLPGNLFFAGLIVRYVDANNYWVIGYNPTFTAYLREVQGGVVTDRATKSFPGNGTEYIEIDVETSGNVISAHFDGGYGLTYTSTFNNTATKFGIFENRDASYKANIFDDFEADPLPTYPITRVGTVLSASGTEDGSVWEPTVIYEGNAVILSGNVFKMWYRTGGAASHDIRYAESSDGQTWTKYSGNPIVSDYFCPFVFKDSGTYYLYANSDFAQFDLYTSSDGVTFTLDSSNVLPLGAGGQWDDYALGNLFVWKEAANDWRMVYEARAGSALTDAWKMGYATSADGRSWSKSGSNPVLSADGSVGGPFVKKIGSTYYLFTSRAAPSGPSIGLHRYKSTNLTTWQQWPWYASLHRSGSQEGEDGYVGQIADFHIVEYSGQAYIYFTGDSDGTAEPGDSVIELATMNALGIGDY